MALKPNTDGAQKTEYSLRLLEAKRLPDGGFPLEAPTAFAVDRVTSGGSYADWGPSRLRRSNPLVSLAVLGVLHSVPAA